MRVRDDGDRYLATTPYPTTKQWGTHAYWQRTLYDLYSAYDGICAYCSEWIPLTTGGPVVEHFIPKSIAPTLAYDWTNYRLASQRFNSRKKDHEDVIDPFDVGEHWFILELPGLIIKPDSALSYAKSAFIKSTIKRLCLNDELSIQSRWRWVKDYCHQHIDFDYLLRHAPFIASELERQALKDIHRLTQIIKPHPTR